MQNLLTEIKGASNSECLATEKSNITSLLRFFRETATHQDKLNLKNLKKLNLKRDNQYLKNKKLKALQQLAINSFSGASKALSQTSIAALDTERELQIRALYPSDPTSADTTDATTGEIEKFEFTMEQMIDELETMAKFKKAPGRSRIEPRHLIFLIKHSKDFASVLLTFITATANGQLSSYDSDSLKIAIGVPVSKTDLENAGIRPLGINESILNLVSRMLIKECNPEIRGSLHKLDFGCLSRGGCESVIHGTNAIWKLTPQVTNLFLITTDFTNAFNTAFRGKLIDMVRRKIPRLLPYMTWRYKNLQVIFRDANLSFSINCERGVSQGEPLSGILFQMLVSEMLADARANVQNTPIMSYQDDNTIVTTILANAVKVLLWIKEKAREYGLELNLTKTRLVSRFPITEEDLAEFPILRSLHRISGEGTTPLESKKGESPSGTLMLGGAVGTDDYIRTETRAAIQAVMKRIAQTKDMIDLHFSPDSPVGDKPMVMRILQFLRLCVGSMPNYIIRTTHPALCEDIAKKVDCAIADCVLHLLNQPNLTRAPDDYCKLKALLTSEESWNVLEGQSREALMFQRMFMTCGGIAISSATSTRDAAFAGSIALTARSISAIIECMYPSATARDVAEALKMPGIEERMYQLCRYTEKDQSKATKAYLLISPLYNPTVERHGMQRMLSARTKQRTHKTVLRAACHLGSMDHFDAKFVSRSAPGATAFLHDFEDYNQLSDQEAQDNILLAIGGEPFMNIECAACGEPILPGMAERHSRACKKAHSSHSRAGMHMKRAVITAFKILNANPSTHEPKTSELIHWRRRAPPVVNEPETRADFSVDIEGVRRICDVTVTGIYETVKQMRMIQRAPAANKREKEKIRQYHAMYDIPRNGFTPIAVESHGALGDHATEILTSANKCNPMKLPGEISNYPRARAAISKGACRGNTEYFNTIRQKRPKTKTGSEADDDKQDDELEDDETVKLTAVDEADEDEEGQSDESGGARRRESEEEEVDEDDEGQSEGSGDARRRESEEDEDEDELMSDSRSSTSEASNAEYFFLDNPIIATSVAHG